MVLLPASHPLAAATALTLDDLRQERHIVLRPDSSEFAAYILSLLTRKGIRPTISQQVVDAQSIPSLVAAGFGISLVPAGIGIQAPPPVTFRPVAPAPPLSEIFAVYLRDAPTPALSTLLATLDGQSATSAAGDGCT